MTLKVYTHVYDRKRKDEAVRIALAGVRRDAVGREWTPFDDLLGTIWLLSDGEMEVLRDKL